jgi:hypothetical protein
MISLDYLKFIQLSVDGDLYDADALDERTVHRAAQAIAAGTMWTVRPALTAFFDGCSFWVASHFNRYEAARRVDARHCEFWCDIKQGTKRDAINFGKGAAA